MRLRARNTELLVVAMLVFGLVVGVVFVVFTLNVVARLERLLETVLPVVTRLPR